MYLNKCLVFGLEWSEIITLFPLASGVTELVSGKSIHEAC